uniref:Protein kinase domain-containing protein n=1 Tax=Cannabis sativa TaxID=3483 RepID=A0A803PY29_CANSA
MWYQSRLVFSAFLAPGDLKLSSPAKFKRSVRVLEQSIDYHSTSYDGLCDLKLSPPGKFKSDSRYVSPQTSSKSRLTLTTTVITNTIRTLKIEEAARMAALTAAKHLILDLKLHYMTLHRGQETPLNWRTRLQIATGVVAALEYLLLFNDPPIYHVSINSSNIMLDENFNAKLSDIGIVTSTGDNETVPHTSCSKDSMDQECSNIIYQLGVLILELVTGQSSDNGDADLVQWIQESRFRNSIHNMIDPDLGNTYDNRELRSLLAVAKLCIVSREKPTFSVLQIFRYFQKKVEIPQ